MQKIIFLAGPMHLFWSTGIFYLLKLRREYAILLMVPAEYKENEKFQHYVKKTNLNVKYLTNKRGIFKHIAYRKLFVEVLKKWNPDAILIHNRFYVECLYMLYWCKLILKKCVRISYQDGRMTFNWEYDFNARLACDSNMLRTKYPAIPDWATKYITKITYRIAYALNVFVYPALVNGVKFSPMIDVWSGRQFQTRQSVNFEANMDLMLAYDENEILQWEKLCGSRPNKISHPLKGIVTRELIDLYGDEGESVQILLLPSYGFATSMMVSGKYDQVNLVNEISKKWIAALNLVMRIYPGKTIGMKLHPGAQLDKIWTKISQRILNAIEGMIIFPAQTQAEKLMIRSEIVLGDVSTALYWASLLSNKVVISFDIFGYEGGDEMKNYSGITYIADLQNYRGNNFMSDSSGRKCETKMTINEYIRSVCVR